VPVTSHKTQQVVAFVAIQIDISSFEDNVEYAIKTNPGLTALSLYSSDGMIMASSVASQVGQNLAVAQKSLFGDNVNDILASIKSGKPYRGSSYSSTLKTYVDYEVFPYAVGTAGTNWAVIVGSSRSQMLADVTQLTWFTLIAAIAIIIVITVILFIIISRTTKPITTVSDTLKDISEGEGDLTRTVNIKSKDEVGDLAGYFNETLAKIRKIVLTIKDEAASLYDIGNDLASNMTETASAMNEITGNIDSIKGRVVNQSASVTETSSTMEQITGNIEKLSETIQNQSASVSQASSAIEEMMANIQSVTQTLVKNVENVKALSEASQSGHEGLQEVAGEIQEIARESEGLMEINAVIDNIASQTNLLSMNAAIEAAHAGEAGKGFAVVADEIRKLAENSSGQSKTINEVLKKITDSIEKISTSTTAVLTRFDAIAHGVTTVAEQEQTIRSAMEEQTEGSRQILDGVAKVRDITTQVKNSAQEMLEGSRQVVTESRNLEAVTEEISNGINEMAGGADQINTTVVHVNDISGRNKDGITVLTEAVAKFRVES
jgi:methyl-accepting chemotaxis protein